MKNFDFIGFFKKAVIISVAIMVVGLVFNLIFGTAMDVAFKGGTVIRYSYETQPDLDAFTTAAKKALGDTATVALDNVNNTDVITVTLPGEVTLDQQEALSKAVGEQFKDNKMESFSSNTLSASMGSKFFLRCLVALALAAGLLLIYVGFRFRKIGGLSAGVSALIALTHDLLIVYFTFVIFRIELNENFVAVMLTILGYSLNDTIVIFDRIRTNRRRMTAPLEEVVNVSMRQVLRRTLVTTVTTFLAILVITIVALVMHVDSIISFAVPMLFGTISGSYSSIFISPGIWTRWQLHKQKAK